MNIGLVLSGGMTKGAYQIGVLKALRNFVPMEDIQYVSTASVGTLNGYAYLTENLENAEQMWRSICDSEGSYFMGKILRSSLLQQNIRNLHQPEKTIAPTFYTALLDINKRNIIYKNLSTVKPERLHQYLRASVAIPIYNKAVPLGNASFYDGALVDDIPVYPLSKHKLDYIICVYFDDACCRFENPRFDRKIIKISFPSDGGLRQSAFISRESVDDMIRKGYEKATQVFSTVFADGYDNLDAIYPAIQHLNQTTKRGPVRITGDVLATNLNRITQRLTKRKII